MHILFITASRIGDAVLSSALLAYLVARHPGASITVACGPAAAPLFAGVPGLARVIALPKRRLGGHWLALWTKTAARHWDLVVDLRASLFAWTVLAKERRVFRHDHALGHRLLQIASLFALDQPPAPRLWTLPSHEAAAARLLPSGPAVLALGPAANWARKVWPTESFVQLAQRLTGTAGIHPGGRIAVFGGSGDRDTIAPVVASLPPDRCIDLAGRADLLTVYACLRRSAIFIGNDSGLMHLAAAAGIPTLGLFGPSKDSLYAPWGPKAAVVRTPERFEELVGGPGYDRFAGGSLMKGLTVDTVERAARDLWKRVGGVGEPAR